jgi:2-oxoglutarate dehydrogenase E1 component
MLLPHGYEGQGPEHSSARLERFLQQCNDHPEVIHPADKSHAIQMANWQIVQPTTPANYFHALRRQLHREFRKPLVVFNPKSLLRLKEASSSFADMAEGTAFAKVIPDEAELNPKSVKRVLLCSGKVYYDLAKRRAETKAPVAIVRVEQLSPFPFHEVAAQLARYNAAGVEVAWCQEEPMNMGGYTYVKDRIANAARQINQQDNLKLRYIGRGPSASTAAGHLWSHKKELEAFLKDAFTL